MDDFLPYYIELVSNFRKLLFTVILYLTSKMREDIRITERSKASDSSVKTCAAS